MLTQKTRYAILAMKKLAEEFGNKTLMISEIAISERIPKRFLESILLDLKNSGYLSSKLGKNGGYYMIKKPSEINLAEIVRLFEGGVAMLPCVSEKYYEKCEHCKVEEQCAIRQTFLDIRNYTFNKLAETTLESLINDELKKINL